MGPSQTRSNCRLGIHPTEGSIRLARVTVRHQICRPERVSSVSTSNMLTRFQSQHIAHVTQIGVSPLFKTRVPEALPLPMGCTRRVSPNSGRPCCIQPGAADPWGLHRENDSSARVKEHAGYFPNERRVFGLKVLDNAPNPNCRDIMGSLSQRTRERAQVRHAHCAVQHGYIDKAPVVRCFVAFSFIIPLHKIPVYICLPFFQVPSIYVVAMSSG